MLDTNLGVPGNVALAVETIVLLLHMTLLNGLDPRFEEVSKCQVPLYFVR
jgi:hypothetical protein